MIPHSKPCHYPADELAFVSQALQAGETARGRLAHRLEATLADFLQADVCLAVPSGEIALWGALRAVGVSPGHEVVVPVYTCPEVFRAVALCGATPVFADVDERYNITPHTVRSALTPYTRAIVITHQFGLAVDVQPFREFRLPLVEDLAHSLGGEFKGNRLGVHGDAGCLSFHATKLLSCGEGGGVFARGQAASRLREIAAGALPDMPHLPFPDVLAGIALSQWSNLPAFLERRRAIAHQYRQAFSSWSWQLTEAHPGDTCFRFPLRVDGNCTALRIAFNQRGIIVRQGVDHLPVGEFSRFPVAKCLFEKTISIPIYPALTAQDVNAIIHAACRVHDTFSDD